MTTSRENDNASAGACYRHDDDDDDDDDYAMFKSNRNSAKSDCGDCEKDLHTGRIPVVYLVLQFIYGLGRVIF